MTVAEKASVTATVDPRQLWEGLERRVANSVADATELVWVERDQHSACIGPASVENSAGRDCAGEDRPGGTTSQSLLVRVIEAGRVGRYQSGQGDFGEVANAIRLAIANSRAQPAAAYPVHLLEAQARLPKQHIALHDPSLSQLDVAGARRWLEREARPGEEAILRWSEDRVLIVNNCGLRQRARVSTVTLEVCCGSNPGNGTARSSARSLESLAAEAVFARARRRHASAPANGSSAEAVDLRGVGVASQILLLSPEATGDLVWLLGQVGLSAEAFYKTPTRSRLAEWLGKSLFSRQILLIDDALRHPCLPFPFDLEGRIKRPVELIANGVLVTPAVDRRLAFELGLSLTPHCLGAGEARPGHLVLSPGTASPSDLLAAAPGGISIDRLEQLEAYDPPRLRFRAVARGLRRIENGRLGVPLADAIWEDSLDRVFRDVAALGATTVSQAREGGLPQGVSAPALLIAPPGVRHG